MIIKNGIVRIHSIREYTSKTTGKVSAIAECLTDDDERERFRGLMMSKELYDVIKKDFVQDKPYICDLDYRVFNNNGYIRIVSIRK